MMAGEEGLVIPTFGIDPEADNHIVPDLQPPAAAPAKPSPTPTRFDPEGKGPRQGMGFLENLAGAFGSGTIEGALNQAEAGRLARGGIPLPETTAIDQGSGFVPELDPEQAKALRDEAQQAVFDQVAYDLAPTRITPASVAGTIVGQALAPSNLFGFGGEAIARGLAQRGFGETAQAAARFGAQASGTSAAVSDIQRVSGAKADSSLTEQLLAGVAGTVLGAGTHVAGQAAGKVAGGVAEFVRNRLAHRESLGVDLPREALPGGSATAEAQSSTLPQPAAQTARTAPAEAALRSEEPAMGMPAAEPDATAPVSREQTGGRAEPPPPAVEQQPTASPDQTAPAAPAPPSEAFEARSTRLSAERDAMQASGADAAPETRDLYEALGSADSDRNADPAWATRHVDEALKLGRTDVADHIVEGAERRAIEAERAASDAAAAEAERDTAGTRYATAVAREDAEQARATADAARRQRDTQAAPDRGALDERSPNAAPKPEAAPAAEPPSLSARTKADWSDIRAASALDVPAWAPRIQSTFDELARGFGIEPPRLSIAKPKFPDEAPLFGANDRRGNILLSDGLSEHHAINNAVHEFGHEVQFRLYDQAPAETQDAIQEAFRAATKRDFGNTSVNQLRPVTSTQKLGDAGQPKRIKVPRSGDEPIPAGSSAASYQHSFEEWFAEQVSRWATTDARPVGVVERFFSGVADAWRKIYERVKGHTPLAPEMKAFLDGRWEGAEAGRVAREPAPKFEIVPADHDELGMVKPGKVDDRLYRILRDGEPVGYTNVRVDGDTADVRDIFTHLGGGNISLSRGVFGPRAMSQIMRQFLDENPGVSRLTGERVSGARRGGAHGLAGTGEQIAVPIPAGRRGRPAETAPRDLIGQTVPNLGEHRVSVPGQEPIQVAPVVVEASDLRTSADAGYDRTLQPRQRDRAASQEQIRDIASNLEPERLGASAEADRGAPIVGGDAQVESGNGRVLAIRRAYAQGGEAADRYRAWLADQGVDVGRYREPVLVRQRLTGLTAEERRAFTDAANRPATLSMSAPERAMADARVITPDSLDLIRNANDLGAAANRDFVRSFVARLPQAERGAMTTAEGGLSAEGAARVRNAVLAKAYDHAGVLSRIAESTTDDIRSISNALVAAAPDWAKLRADIARGAVRGDVDLTGELLEAVTRTADLRAKGQKLDTFLDQQDAFDRLPRPVEAFMRMFYDERGRRAASGPVVAERLRGYAGEARKVLADQGLDLGMPTVSAEDIQAAAARRGQRAPAGDPALLFSRRQPTDPRQISFFDRVAESLRSAEPAGASKRSGDAADFLRQLGTDMADRAGREGPQPGSVLDRLAGDGDQLAGVAGTSRPPTLAEDIQAGIRAQQDRAAALAGDDSFTSQLAREMRTEVEQSARTQRERPDLLDSAETSVVEAATRLHGTPAERRVPVDELRASVPGLSTPEFERAVIDLHGRGVARFADGAVSLDHAGVRAAQEVIEQHVHTEAQSIGRELFGETPEVLQRRRAAAAQTVDEPDQIRQGRPVEDQGTAPIEGDARPARLEEMAQRLASDFETVLRTGRVQPGARGQFNTSTGVARVRSLSDLDTTLHEIGHSVQQSPQTAALVDPVIARNRAELAPLGAGTGATGDAEAFAELFRLYATNRAYAERTYPGATADLERTLRSDLPRQAAALDQLRTDLDTLHRADSGAVVSSDVITPKPDKLFQRIKNMFGAEFVGAAATDPRGGVFYQWRDAIYTHMLSPHHPINRAMYALGRVYRDSTGKVLDLLPQDDPYILARVGSGANDVARSMLEHGVRGARSDTAAGPSLRDAIEAGIGKKYNSQQWHDLGAYLTARRMVAEYERFAAGEIPNPPGKLSAGDYAKAVSEFEAKYPTFADAAEHFYEFNRNLVQRHFDLGLFTKEYYDAAMARKDYAPLMRDMEDLGRSGGSGGGGRDGASMMKTFRGSQRAVMNPLDSTVKKVYDLEQAAALNEVKAALARVAEIAGPGSGFIAEPIPANRLSAVAVDIADAMRAAGSKANVDKLDLNALVLQAEGMLGDDVFTHIFRQEPIRPGAEPITFYYVNGERRALRLADGAYGRELYRALNVMTAPERNIFMSVLQISGAILKQGVTKSLGFMYRNFSRDQGTSVATGGRSYMPFISAIKGAVDVVSGGGDFEKYLSFGGFAGGVIHHTVENSTLSRGGAQRMFREKNVVSRVLGASAKLAELSEASTRAGLFQSYVKQAQEMGFDAYNSALYATFKANDYIDFRKVGSHLAVAARLIPFLNASAQGTDKEARALFGDMVRLEGKRMRGEELSRIELDNLKDSRAAWVKTLAWGMLFGGGTAYMNSENPEWFGSAAWRRERGYNIMPLGPAGHWLSSPKPFGFVRNISDMFEYGVEYLIRRDPTIATKLGHALAEAHTLPFTNPFIDLYYGLKSNYDSFRDRPIVPPSMQGVQPSEQYTRYTSEIAKGIGAATGWSPMKVDYAVKNLGGGTAQDFLANSTTLIKWMQGKPGGKEKTIWDLPLMRELTQNLAVGNEATTRFYGLVGQKVGTLEQAANTYGQKISAGDRTGAADYLRGLPEAERAYATLKKTTFDAEDQLMHPLILARSYNDVVSGMSRALGNDNLLPEGDIDRKHQTFSKNQLQPIHVDGPTTEKLRNELDALSMVTARNALIATGADGMQGVPVKDPAEFMDRIRMLNPEVARELRGRLAAKRLYDPAEVAERWPEVKARLLKDGETAEFNDLLPHRARNATRARKRALADD